MCTYYILHTSMYTTNLHDIDPVYATNLQDIIPVEEVGLNIYLIVLRELISK